MSKDPEENLDSSVALINHFTLISTRHTASSSEFDPVKMQMHLVKTLQELKTLREKMNNSCQDLEHKALDDEKVFRSSVDELRNQITMVKSDFLTLDKRISQVATKTVHLSDQLERKNVPRMRLEEANELVVDFYKFLSSGTFSMININNCEENHLIETAARIRKLNKLCLELPDDDPFLKAKQRLALTAQNIESELLTRFKDNFVMRKIPTLKKIVEVLGESKKPNVCIEAYVGEMLNTMPKDLADLVGLPKGLSQVELQVMEIFPRPHVVMNQILQALFNTKLSDHLKAKIVPITESQEKYLCSLFREYLNVDRFISTIETKLKTMTEPHANLKKIRNELFASYLESYIIVEKQWLKQRLDHHLRTFYKACGHDRKNYQSLHLNDLKREMQAKLSLGLKDEERQVYEQVLVSHQLAVDIIGDAGESAKRCDMLSDPSQRAYNTKTILMMVGEALINEHINYGMNMVMQGLTLVDGRNGEPLLTVIKVVHEITISIQFFDNWYIGSILTSLNKADREMQECQLVSQQWRATMETKLNQGLEKFTQAVQNHVQQLLNQYQKKTDFCNSSAEGQMVMPIQQPTQACRHMCAFITKIFNEIERNLDGENRALFLNDLGLKLTRILSDHLYTFTYSTNGGMQIMQDMSMYKEALSRFQSPMVNVLIDVMFKLVNLFVIGQENINQVKQEYIDMKIPKDLVYSFIQLRSDSKQSHTANNAR